MITKQQGSASEAKIWSSIDRDGRHYTDTTTVDTRNIITYEAGPKYASVGANWKECTHTWYSAMPANVTFAGENQYGTRLVGTGLYPQYWDYYSSVAISMGRGLRIPTNSELLFAASESLKRRCENTILPYSDVIQLARRVNGLNGFHALIESLTSWLRPKSFTDLVKKSAGADLAWKWGVKSLARTITDLVSAAAALDRFFAKLRELNMREQTNFKATVNADNSGNWTPNALWIYDHSGGYCVRSEYRLTAKVKATVHFRCRVKYDTSDAIRAKLAWDSLGLSNIFSTVWDLAPWSFLVDWFARISDFVAQLDRFYFRTTPLEKISEISDCWATQTVFAGAEFRNFVVGTTGFSRNTRISGTTALSAYGQFMRFPIPVGTVQAWIPSIQLSGGGLTPAQNLTGLELMAQRYL